MTLNDPANALRSQRLAEAVQAELAALRADPDVWADYLAEAESTECLDGLD